MSLEKLNIERYVVTIRAEISQADLNIIKRVRDRVGEVDAIFVARWRLNCSLTEARNLVKEL